LDHREEEAAADRAEAERVAYVAATRARDLLVIATIGDELREDSWLAPLYPALYPPPDRYRDAVRHPGCPAPGDRTVLRRPEDCPGPETSVRPGVHRPMRGSHEVFWFDPSVLDLGEHKDLGLAYEEVLSGSPEPGLSRYREWQRIREEMVATGSMPQYR